MDAKNTSRHLLGREKVLLIKSILKQNYCLTNQHKQKLTKQRSKMNYDSMKAGKLWVNRWNKHCAGKRNDAHIKQNKYLSNKCINHLCMISMLRMKKMNRSSEMPHGHLLTPKKQAVLFHSEKVSEFCEWFVFKKYFFSILLWKLKILSYVIF